MLLALLQPYTLTAMQLSASSSRYLGYRNVAAYFPSLLVTLSVSYTLSLLHALFTARVRSIVRSIVAAYTVALDIAFLVTHGQAIILTVMLIVYHAIFVSPGRSTRLSMSRQAVSRKVTPLLPASKIPGLTSCVDPSSTLVRYRVTKREAASPHLTHPNSQNRYSSDILR